MEAIKRSFTIWRFTSPTTGDATTAAKPSEPREIEHEYQRVLGRLDAFGPKDAIEKWERVKDAIAGIN